MEYTSRKIIVLEGAFIDVEPSPDVHEPTTAAKIWRSCEYRHFNVGEEAFFFGMPDKKAYNYKVGFLQTQKPKEPVIFSTAKLPIYRLLAEKPQSRIGRIFDELFTVGISEADIVYARFPCGVPPGTSANDATTAPNEIRTQLQLATYQAIECRVRDIIAQRQPEPVRVQNRTYQITPSNYRRTGGKERVEIGFFEDCAYYGDTLYGTTVTERFESLHGTLRGTKHELKLIFKSDE